jgi:hypothetical protein
MADTSRREWPLTTVAGPLERIEWLDHPALTAVDRKALARAFDQAAGYDENARVAVVQRRASRYIPVRFTPTHR